jgi:hypothetical protein
MKMTDTPQHVLDAERRQHEIFRAMTPGKRWEQFLALRSQNPDLSEADIEDKVRECVLHATT